MNEINQFSGSNPIEVEPRLMANGESSEAVPFLPVAQEGSVDTASPTPVPLPQKPYLWFTLWFLVSCSLGGLSAFGFLWLTALPPATDCQNISSISPDIERLHCAQEAARSGELPELLAGLELVETWTAEHPLYNEANRWMSEWSHSILQIARQRMTQNDLEGALELANRIPESSPLYTEAQETIARWQTQWQAGEAVYNQAQEALKQQDWDLAYARIFDLREHPYPYWSDQQANALSDQVLAEKRARQLFAEAASIAQLDQPQQLQIALERVQPIDRSTHTWTEVQPSITEWGEELLAVSYQHWQAQQFQEAIALAELVKLSEELTPEAENLIKLSQARQLAVASGAGWIVSPRHIWRMMEAIAAAQQIPPESRFHEPAQFSLESWQAQLQDMRRLQSAQIMASLGNRDAVQQAIEQAAQIDFSRPRRLQAQTLIAHWRIEAERMEDQPILLYAQRMAESGTLPALQAAIAQVNQIPSGRILHGEAQGLAYEWSQTVEILEDEPFLTLAQSQAKQGLLAEAVQTASVIRPGRMLYSKAQAAIKDWQAQLNPMEPRPRRSTQTAMTPEDQTDEVRSAAVDSDQAIEAEAEVNKLLDTLRSPSPQPIVPSPSHLPRTIDELMQTHPRPVTERLPATRLQPSPVSDTAPENRWDNQPSSATGGSPAPTLESVPVLEWSPVPSPDAMAEPVPNPDFAIPDETPASPPPVAPIAPILTLPAEELGNEASDELPSSSEPGQDEPTAASIKEILPLGEEGLEHEPISLGDSSSLVHSY